MVAGVIYDPTRNEMFSAEKGGGAYLNGHRIRVSAAQKVAISLLATGFPSRRRHENINVHFYYQLGMLSHGVRRAGAAATDLAYVACGRLEGFWEFGLKPAQSFCLFGVYVLLYVPTRRGWRFLE